MHYPLPFRNFKSRIPCRSKASVHLMNNLYPIIPLCIIITYPATDIGTPVVHENQFEIRIRLGKDTVNAFPDVILNFINRDYNGDCAHNDFNNTTICVLRRRRLSDHDGLRTINSQYLQIPLTFLILCNVRSCISPIPHSFNISFRLS